MRSPATAWIGNAALGFGGAAMSNSVRLVMGVSPSLLSRANLAAILRPRKPPPPRMEIRMNRLRRCGGTIALGCDAVHRSRMLDPMPFRVLVNPRFGGSWDGPLSDDGFRRAKAEISSWPDYRATPLFELPGLAR